MESEKTIFTVNDKSVYIGMLIEELWDLFQLKREQIKEYQNLYIVHLRDVDFAGETGIIDFFFHRENKMLYKVKFSLSQESIEKYVITQNHPENIWSHCVEAYDSVKEKIFAIVGKDKIVSESPFSTILKGNDFRMMIEFSRKDVNPIEITIREL